jgi:hypothetical protein
MSSDILNMDDAGHLGELILGVERGRKMRYYPLGSDSADNPLRVVLRAFTHDGGGLYTRDADIRDAYVWTSGFTERWFPVRDLMKALANTIDARHGMNQPMAVIEVE